MQVFTMQAYTMQTQCEFHVCRIKRTKAIFPHNYLYILNTYRTLVSGCKPCAVLITLKPLCYILAYRGKMTPIYWYQIASNLNGVKSKQTWSKFYQQKSDTKAGKNRLLRASGICPFCPCPNTTRPKATHFLYL